MRDTNKEMYEKVKAAGTLSKNRLMAYHILCRLDYNERHSEHNGMTAEEIRWVAENTYKVANGRHLQKRLSELEKMDAIHVTGTRKCRISKNNAMTWQITGRMPLKKPVNVKIPTKRDKQYLIMKEICDHVRTKYICGPEVAQLLLDLDNI